MKREAAEKHWEYTEGLILLMLEMMHYLYVEAMVHGAKHNEENTTGEEVKEAEDKR